MPILETCREAGLFVVWEVNPNKIMRIAIRVMKLACLIKNPLQEREWCRTNFIKFLAQWAAKNFDIPLSFNQPKNNL